MGTVKSSTDAAGEQDKDDEDMEQSTAHEAAPTSYAAEQQAHKEAGLVPMEVQGKAILYSAVMRLSDVCCVALYLH